MQALSSIPVLPQKEKKNSPTRKQPTTEDKDLHVHTVTAANHTSAAAGYLLSVLSALWKNYNIVSHLQIRAGMD